MSQGEPTKSYTYQPYGTAANMNRSAPEKLYGVVAIERGTVGHINGLTKEQAVKVLAILREGAN